MAFVKTTWVDRVTAVSAAQLNRIEQGIGDAHAKNVQAAGAFRAFRNGASIGIAQQGVVPFDSKAAPAGFDVSGWYDTALFRFTPQLAGYYNLRAAVAFTTGAYAADTAFQLALRKNATVIAWGPLYSLRGGTNPTMAVADLVVANGTTDYFDIIAWTSTGVGPTIVTGAINTYLSGDYEGTA